MQGEDDGCCCFEGDVRAGFAVVGCYAREDHIGIFEAAGEGFGVRKRAFDDCGVRVIFEEWKAFQETTPGSDVYPDCGILLWEGGLGESFDDCSAC